MTTRANNVTEIEETLWSALAASLDTDESNMIIIDGLDHIVGGEVKSVEFLSRLNKVSNTKVIVLSKALSKPLNFLVREFSIKPNLIHHDLCRFVKRSLASYHHFHDRKEEEKQTIVHRIVESAKGDFVMADLIIELLREEKTHDGFTHALKHMPKSTTEAMEKLIAILKLTASETKLMISWLLVSERPLSLLEIQSLLEVDVKSNKRSRRLRFDVEQQIRDSFGSLVDIRNGIVCFRHATVLGYLLEQSRTGKHWVKLHDAHRDLTQRCLAYTNTHVTTNAECTTDILEATKIDRLFQQHHLLEYSTRYWTTHFRASPIYQRNGKHEITSEFRSSFSTSVLLAQIERSCWGTQTSIYESLEMHQLALSLRKIVLTESHESVLQCLISIASSYEKTSKTIEASHYYYQATTLSRKILGAYHEITITCAESYITCVRSEVTTKRTETVTRKEELFQLVIAAHEYHHGHTSKEVIGFKKLLAKLYMEIQEVTLATEIYREAYNACVEFYGKFHSETMTVSWEFTGVLQRASRHEEVLVYIRSLFETAEDTMDVCDSRRITITVNLLIISRNLS